MASRTTFDPEREITDRIIAAIEAGTPPWRKPWTGAAGGVAYPLRVTGERYRGINVLMLWLAAAENGYSSAHWMTYRQAAELGGQVRKGERSVTVVKYGTIETDREETADDEEGEDRPRRRGYLRAYRVFNADQVDGLPETYYRKPEPAEDLGTGPDARLEAYFVRLGARMETSAEPRAYYHPGRDVIHMPPIASFLAAQGYYETLGHEAVHWTGGEARLDRITRCANRMAYAFEELVAEIGQCILFATLGLVPSIDQSAAYVEGWLRALKDDKRMIFRAAGEAQKAVDFITARCGVALTPALNDAAEVA